MDGDSTFVFMDGVSNEKERKQTDAYHLGREGGREGGRV
jgi:hypothetical protein